MSRSTVCINEMARYSDSRGKALPAGLVPCFCWYTRLCRVDLDCNRGFEYVLVYRMLMFFRYRVLTMSYHENTQASIDYVCWKQGSVERKGQALAPNRPEARDRRVVKEVAASSIKHQFVTRRINNLRSILDDTSSLK